MSDQTTTANMRRMRTTLETAADPAGSLKTQAGGYGLATVLPGPKAYPSGLLQPEPVYLPSAAAPTAHIPDSLSQDGVVVYGHRLGAGGALTRLWRSNDGLATIEDGADLSTLTAGNALILGEVISNVVKTWSGYYVTVVNTSGTESGGVYWSASFTSGFTRVLTTGVSLPKLPQTVYHGKHALYSRYIVGEYSQTLNYASRFYMTRDGGQTWVGLLARTVVDPAVNLHCHASCVDVRGGRIYLSYGDGNNRGMFWSDDDGATWTEAPDPVTSTAWQPVNSTIPGDKTNGYQQPTLMVPTDAGILTFPDTVMTPSIQIMRRDTGSILVPNEVWRHDLVHTIAQRRAAHQMFAKGPYATVAAEIYIQNNRNTALAPDTSAGQEMWIVGSGDGGRSWHNLATIKHPTASSLSMAEGIVGADTAGYLYAYVGLGNTPYIARFRRADVTWQF